MLEMDRGELETEQAGGADGSMSTPRDGGTTTPDSHVTRSRLLPLNSSRLATDVIKRVAVELGLPRTASKADILPMIEGKLAEGKQEPRNMQVRLTEEDETLRVIELVN